MFLLAERLYLQGRKGMSFLFAFADDLFAAVALP